MIKINSVIITRCLLCARPLARAWGYSQAKAHPLSRKMIVNSFFCYFPYDENVCDQNPCKLYSQTHTLTYPTHIHVPHMYTCMHMQHTFTPLAHIHTHTQHAHTHIAHAYMHAHTAYIHISHACPHHLHTHIHPACAYTHSTCTHMNTLTFTHTHHVYIHKQQGLPSCCPPYLIHM